jgi:hypothetical protein
MILPLISFVMFTSERLTGDGYLENVSRDGVCVGCVYDGTGPVNTYAFCANRDGIVRQVHGYSTVAECKEQMFTFLGE